jgi:ribosomal protein L3
MNSAVLGITNSMSPNIKVKQDSGSIIEKKEEKKEEDKPSGMWDMGKMIIKKLEIIDIDKKENLLVIKGSIPGKTGNLVSMNLNH